MFYPVKNLSTGMRRTRNWIYDPVTEQDLKYKEAHMGVCIREDMEVQV